MPFRIALAGNPNSGKTTLFNALTGSNQYVGNWPGVTIEKKEGKLRSENFRDVTVVDLPGIYSLSPYSLEEVVARDYLITEKSDAIINIVDGANLERNLYLTTQLAELGIPMVVAINMMDVVEKSGDRINPERLSEKLGIPVLGISALKRTGITEVAEKAVELAKSKTALASRHRFSDRVEKAIKDIEALLEDRVEEEHRRWTAIKVFERDMKVMESLDLDDDLIEHIESVIESCETEMDDDSESIITNERYLYIASVVKECYRKKSNGRMTTSDRIDRVVTNRWLALPIFALVMFAVYYVSVTTVGTWVTD